MPRDFLESQPVAAKGSIAEALHKASEHSAFAIGLLIIHAGVWFVVCALLSFAMAWGTWFAFEAATIDRWDARVQMDIARAEADIGDAVVTIDGGRDPWQEEATKQVVTPEDRGAIPAPSHADDAILAIKKRDDFIALVAGQQSLELLKQMKWPFVFIVTIALMLMATIAHRLVLYVSGSRGG